MAAENACGAKGKCEASLQTREAALFELYLLSASVGDREERGAPSKRRKWIAMGLAGAVLGYFLIAKRLRSPVSISGFGILL
jgi:hypothetical protein